VDVLMLLSLSLTVNYRLDLNHASSLFRKQLACMKLLGKATDWSNNPHFMRGDTQVLVGHLHDRRPD
jgi:hypothetical protein